jgi:LacI family transcriptional regulator
LLSGFAGQGQGAGRGFRLAGFDDIEEAAQSYPSLTSVHCGIEAFGRERAAELLAWLTRGERPAEERRTEVGLVARESSLGPAAAGPEG